MEFRIVNSMNLSPAQQLDELRTALLALHKTLVDSEKIEYENSFGAIQTQKRFLELLIDDPWFAWLKPLSSMVVSIDEILEAKEGVGPQQWHTVKQEAKGLLIASEEGHGFARNYFDALQRAPDVILAHAEVMKVLKA